MTVSTGAPHNVSALTTFISSNTPASTPLTHASHYHHLALQVLHNLQYQHDWTSLCIHTHSPISETSKLLPRPLISGLPPHRIYVHPDEQVELLKAGLKEADGEVEREWVLPTQLTEKWSLRRFAEVFDAVGELPERPEGVDGGEGVERKDVRDEGQKSRGKGEKRRGGKRVLLATVNDDSTIVYYIVHDGIVKPRQN
ncbi:hypothetical protein MMC08_004287 [Hypocenomyce scalaris]|nr:hypothetical protein [Hypocenomyce scalaris]